MTITKKEIAGLAEAINAVATMPGADRETAYAIIHAVDNYLWEIHHNPEGFRNAAKGLVDLSGRNYAKELEERGNRYPQP
ncbi:MAG: hypothetical protein E6R03_03215 [Hyphomicrobiaceae bacterium]|nr:MAG: hypothetical protein E6R03_03215 [Hyphomicrobiaceae bacterium]